MACNRAVRQCRLRTVLSGSFWAVASRSSKRARWNCSRPSMSTLHHWVPFAQDVIDCFLKWGFAVVSYEEDEDEVQREALLAKRRKLAEPPPQRPRSSKAAKAVDKAQAKPPLIVPIIPALGSYELAFKMGGRVGYKRQYKVYTNAPSLGTREDEEARVVVRQAPDAIGNINSPLASVFELGSFVGSLTELALTAESSRARPHLVTQMRKKDTQGLDPSSLFFDTESRGVQSTLTLQVSVSGKALQMQTAMCAMINVCRRRTPLRQALPSR